MDSRSSEDALRVLGEERREDGLREVRRGRVRHLRAVLSTNNGTRVAAKPKRTTTVVMESTKE